MAAFIFPFSALFIAFLGVELDSEFVYSVEVVVASAAIAFATLTISLRIAKQAGFEADEDSSDDFAAVRLKESFDIKCPSLALRDLLEQLEARRSRVSRVVWRILHAAAHSMPDVRLRSSDEAALAPSNS